MDVKSIAPCGVICDLCLGFQREKNTCAGCNRTGSKLNHCKVCSITMCPEKKGNSRRLCISCSRFPCKRIKDLDKRYTTKYGESPIQNLRAISRIGMASFVKKQGIKWKCPECGHLLCVHRDVCLNCGAKNKHFPKLKKK
ncbi:Uncharacterised protein [uncultured archaeon]|nr:Uncharacterised protein [uncultured archaeon]